MNPEISMQRIYGKKNILPRKIRLQRYGCCLISHIDVYVNTLQSLQFAKRTGCISALCLNGDGSIFLHMGISGFKNKDNGEA